MQTLMHDWYWARAKAGPYTVIASHITATKAYGYETQNVYMLANDDEIVADDDRRCVSRANASSPMAKPASPLLTSRAIPTEMEIRAMS